VRNDRFGPCFHAPALAEKVAWFARNLADTSDGDGVETRGTHMSWVFLTGDRVYKLKKPVRFPYLDFSTLERREAACRAELRLNRRLARDVYLDVAPLTVAAGQLSVGGKGEVVDWLVVMRRLDERATLEHSIMQHRVEVRQLDNLTEALAVFYRHTTPVITSASVELSEWLKSFDYNRRVLLEPRLGLPSNLVRRVDRAQHRYLEVCADQIRRRVQDRRIIDGHGDLRPEHIWLDDGIRIIDCLEFNDRLRHVDPFDELAFLTVECERLGAAWVGEYVLKRIQRRMHDEVPPALFLFYRCHRAMLRARLAIAHLLEPNPRTPDKWPRTARAYLAIAAREATALERLIRTPQGRRGPGPGAGV
jgi:aminoglycoside phosphotransferase family enzyme